MKLWLESFNAVIVKVRLYPFRLKYKKAIILYTGPGIGDTLALSPVARKLKENGYKIIFVGKNKYVTDAAKRLEDFDHVLCFDPALLPSSWSKPRIIDANIWHKLCIEKKAASLIDLLAEKAGLDNIRDKAIRYRLNKEEEEFGMRYKQRHGDYLVFHADCGTVRTDLLKLWPNEHWQKLIDMQALPVILIGSKKKNQYLFRNCIDMRDKTSIHQAAALLKHSRLFVGLPSSFAWFSSAFKKDAIIISGGWEPPIVTDHTKSRHLASDMECAPCLNPENICPYGVKCMAMITPEIANKKISEVLKDNR